VDQGTIVIVLLAVISQFSRMCTFEHIRRFWLFVKGSIIRCIPCASWSSGALQQTKNARYYKTAESFMGISSIRLWARLWGRMPESEK